MVLVAGCSNPASPSGAETEAGTTNPQPGSETGSSSGGSTPSGETTETPDPASSGSTNADPGTTGSSADGSDSSSSGDAPCPEVKPACPDGCETITMNGDYTLYDPDGPGPAAPTTYNLRIWAPTEPGTYPVGILLSGTSEGDGGLSLETVARKLAEAGVIAAQVGYNNESASGCGCDGEGIGGGNCNPFKTYYNKAQAIFDASDEASAIRRIVAATAANKAQASIEEGVVVGGFSQGTVVAHQAGNWLASELRAAYLIGTGNRPRGGPACGRQDWYCNEADHDGVIASDKVRLFTGERDVYFAQAQDDADACGDQSAENARIQSERVSGCESDTDVCELRTGAGWRVIRNSDVTDGSAGHQFYSGDPIWEDGESGLDAIPWSASENVAWMLERIAAGRCG